MLHIIIGPMFGGKTSEMIRLIRRERTIKTPILIVNSDLDNRGGNQCVYSHDKVKEGAVSIDKLMKLAETDQFKSAKVIFVEEGQFYSDLYDFVKLCCDDLKKTVYVFGLDGDSNRQPFGDILKIIPLADTITKLHALCKICGDGTPAIFTQRIAKNTDKVLVGGADDYQAVCRKHYLGQNCPNFKELLILLSKYSIGFFLPKAGKN